MENKKLLQNYRYMCIYRRLEQLKHQSHCIDKQVACIITDSEYNIISTGVNRIIKCDKNCDDKENRICNTEHAEVMACKYIDRTKYRNRYAFINLFPCAPCQETLAEYGVRKIISFTPKHKDQVFEEIEIAPNISEMLLDHNSMDKQLSVAQGELCELVTSISDYFYRPEKEIKIEEILDEIVDVELMLMQLKKILWYDDNEVYNKLRDLQKGKYSSIIEKIKTGSI
jgi:deoxycytidylate deaminase